MDDIYFQINEDVDRLKRLTTDTGHNDLNGELSSYAVAHAAALVALAEEAFLSAKRIAQIEQAFATRRKK